MKLACVENVGANELMISNADLLKSFHASKAHFYLCDFHVHTWASADVWDDSRFSQLTAKEVQLLTPHREVLVPLQNNPAELERHLLEMVDPEEFLSLICARRDEIAQQFHLSAGEDWAIVGLTDHNICGYSSRIAQIAWETRKDRRIIALPGLELDISHDLALEGNEFKKVSIHVLTLFAPGTKADDIRIAITDASSQKLWQFGEVLPVSALSDFVSALRHHAYYPGICVAAHVTGSKGIHEETKLAILNNLEAEIARTRGHLESLETNQRPPIEEYLTELVRQQNDRQGIHIAVLEQIGACGFDALQIQGRQDEKHYRYLHRFREEHGRAVPIVASDAHSTGMAFSTDDNISSFLKLKPLCASNHGKDLFDEIRTSALKFGETRFGFGSCEAVSAWIEGIEVRYSASCKDRFWTTRGGAGTDFVIPLSRNLNCLIGGRGSGKSALIEAIAFMLSDKGEFDDKHRWTEDYYRRARATLAGATVRLCWRTTAPIRVNLKKRAMFGSRYFDADNRHRATEYCDIDNTQLLASEMPPPRIEVFRTHDIEKHASAENLRTLIDSLCGEPFLALQGGINDLKELLAGQRKEILAVCQAIAALTAENSPLREYLVRKQKYEQLNLPEVQEKYDALDKSVSAAQIVKQTVTKWQSIDSSFDELALRKAVTAFFNNTRKKVLSKDGQVIPGLTKLAEALGVPSASDVSEAKIMKAVLDAATKLHTSLANITSIFAEVQGATERVVKTEKESLAQSGLPEGGEERQTKKEAFEEAHTQLEQYIELESRYQKLLAERRATFEELKLKCVQRTSLRRDTAERITGALARDLDPTVLVVEAQARDMADKEDFLEWLTGNLTAGLTQQYEVRFKCLLEEKNLQPENLRNILLSPTPPDVSLLIVDKQKVSEGRINQAEAESVIEANRAVRLMPVVNAESFKRNDVPKEIENGLMTFPQRDGKLLIDCVLALDEIEISDMPVVLLNDRPLESGSVLRPLEDLSTGQRCSALLPILLLTGTNPLLIDQPEDNLDNRLIRQVIVNILGSIKLRRQVIIATHNPNLPVLGDAEETIVLAATDERKGELRTIGDLDDYQVVKNITDIMEGGREAFQYRQSVYQTHWNREFLENPAVD